jgi:hypothetical protein
MRHVGGISWKILVVALAASFLATPHARSARAGTTTLLVPAYFYPSGAGLAAWEQLGAAARSVTIEAILNPGSGPGTARDPNYVAVVDKLRRAGGRVLGYVDTAYGKRPLAAVEQDIRTYRRFYQVDGFFLDQMANTPQAVPYYEAIYQSIKGSDPGLKVVGNPGTPYTLQAYLNAADALVIFEGTGASYAEYEPTGPAPWIAQVPPSRLANIVYAVADAAGMQRALDEARRTRAGTVFITDGKPPNPYGGLPGYWTQEVAAIQALDAPEPVATAATSVVPAEPAATTAGPELPAATTAGPELPAAEALVIAMPAFVASPVPPCPCRPRPLRRLWRPCRPAPGPALAPGLVGRLGP